MLVSEFTERIWGRQFFCDNDVLFCKKCSVKASAKKKKYNIQQYIARAKHIQQLNLRNQQKNKNLGF